jgi:hypothetical protein
VSILATLTTSTALGFEGAGGDVALRDQTSSPGAIGTIAHPPPSVADSVTVASSPAVSPPPSVVVLSPTTMADPTTTEIIQVRAQAEEAVRLEVSDSVQGLAPISFGGFDVPTTTVAAVSSEDCIRRAKTSPLQVDGIYDRNLIARMTHDVFECMTALAGFDAVAPTALRRWNGAAVWGFSSLADQVAAEAVVVAYCESVGFNPRALTRSNGFGYGGLFQMGVTEMGRFGERGSSRYDPVDNAVAAANYFVHQYRNRAGWGGWSPWAVVNTNFNDEINDQVRVPVLPRFTSTDPEFAGRSGAELPAWAVDPWSWEVPHWSGTGCPYSGGRWPAAVPLDE